MTDTNTCATCDFYRTGSSPGHGSCHLNPPGNAVSNGFPLVAAVEWCAKGATGGSPWRCRELEIVTISRGLINLLVRERDEATVRLSASLHRNLWQRICNTVPWDTPDGNQENPRR